MTYYPDVFRELSPTIKISECSFNILLTIFAEANNVDVIRYMRHLDWMVILNEDMLDEGKSSGESPLPFRENDILNFKSWANVKQWDYLTKITASHKTIAKAKAQWRAKNMSFLKNAMAFGRIEHRATIMKKICRKSWFF